jgi:hypothetical protein
VLAGEIRRVERRGAGVKMTVAGSAGNTKKSGLGSIKEGLCGFCQMQGWKPVVK